MRIPKELEKVAYSNGPELFPLFLIGQIHLAACFSSQTEMIMLWAAWSSAELQLSHVTTQQMFSVYISGLYDGKLYQSLVNKPNMW